MLVLDDGKTIIAESGAVCEYIVEAYASKEQKTQFLGGDSPLDQANVRSWAYYSEGTLLLHALVRVDSARSSSPADSSFLRSQSRTPDGSCLSPRRTHCQRWRATSRPT